MPGDLSTTLGLLRKYERLGEPARLRPLLDEIARIQREDYTRRALAGINARDQAMPPLRSPRKGAYAGATGAPRTPFGARSGAIANYRVDWRQAGDGRWELVTGITDGAHGGGSATSSRSKRRRAKKTGGAGRRTPFAAIYRYQETGAGRNPAGRDLDGVSPTALRRIQQAVRDHLASTTRNP